MINKSGKGPITEFPVNSFVLVEYPDTRMGRMPPTKLHPIKKGPFRVVKFVGAKYDLINLNNNQTEKGIHVTRLLPFDYDELRTIPSDVARRDIQATIVEAIRSHEGDIKRKSTLDFLVKWKDVEDSGNLWLPWSELRNNPVLHQYLADHHLAKLIPKEFKAAYD